MDPVDTAKRVTRSQLPLPDSNLNLNRSPLKDARMAQRNYHSDQPPDDPDTDDEILLSPGKSRHVANSNPPHDEYNPDPMAPQDGRELKRLKRDTEDSKKRDVHEGGSDVENTDTNFRFTVTPSHTRNVSEPVLGTTKKSTKPRSTSKQATPASPKGKSRARSVPVFPVLDLSNPPTTPWRRRARSRSPSKERDSPKLQPTFSSLASIPDDAAMPPPNASVPEPSRRPAMPPAPIIQPPSTPVPSMAYRTVFATPMSPLTPLPETPRLFQARADFDGFPRTIGWGVDIEVS
ncbi:hypothetical protein C8R46DRAFT_27001 [Mycena filopes]|nr:hypothetical protein C8R46DRAFT_27001 [Mycena filopes]